MSQEECSAKPRVGLNSALGALGFRDWKAQYHGSGGWTFTALANDGMRHHLLTTTACGVNKDVAHGIVAALNRSLDPPRDPDADSLQLPEVPADPEHEAWFISENNPEFLGNITRRQSRFIWNAARAAHAPAATEVEPMEVERGEVKVNHCVVLCASAQMVTLMVDLGSKRAEVGLIDVADGLPCPDPQLVANENTLFPDRDHLGTPTVLRFTAYPGFRVWMATVSRYCLRVVLLHNSVWV